MESYQPQIQQQHQSSHMMKTTRSGRPFVKDIHDLYSALVVSLPMETHRNLFRSYSNSFTTEEAIANLGSLKFTQSHRMPDPKDPSRIITTTTTTTFSMTKEMAKSVCQTFMDARLFENLADSGSRTFKDKNFYGLTPKGLYLLERFVSRNCISAPHLTKLFALRSTPIKLHLVERDQENDSIIFSRQNVESTFRRFAGIKPNDITNKDGDIDKEVRPDEPPGQPNEIDRNLGIEVKDRLVNHILYHYTFSGAAATDWLCDFSTLITREEAVKISTEFLQFGFIEPLSDRTGDSRKKSEKSDSPTFKHSKSTHYRISEEGVKFAMWDYDTYGQTQLNGTHANGGNERSLGLREMLSYHNIKNGRNKNNMNHSRVRERQSSDDGSRSSTMDSETQVPAIPGNVLRRQRSRRNSLGDKDGSNHLNSKESNAKKLQQILEDQNLHSLFMDFLKSNFCEENLLFLLDVKAFRTKYGTNTNENGRPLNPQEQENLISHAFRIYNTYLAPASPNELNIDHGLRQQMIQYMTSIVTRSGNVEQPHEDPITCHLYDKIEETIFRLLASDSVPKFVKTERYLALTHVRRPGGEASSIHSHKSSSSTSANEDHLHRISAEGGMI